MSWIFNLKSGALVDANGAFRGRGYSGYDDGDGVPEPGEGKNDPTKQAERGIGPIPEGRWFIGAPFFHEKAGPYTMRLTPHPFTRTYGRSGFLIHGDSAKKPGSASHGCIVLNRELRMAVWESGDHEVMVISGIEEQGKDVA